MKSGRDSRAMRQDDTNDFNDDFTLLDGFSRVEAEGNVAEHDEKEAKGLSRDDDLYGGYGGYGGSGKGKRIDFINKNQHSTSQLICFEILKTSLL